MYTVGRWPELFGCATRYYDPFSFLFFFFGEEEYNPSAIGEEITAACIRKQKKLQQHADEDGAEGS